MSEQGFSKAIQKLNEYRMTLKRFPAGMVVKFADNAPDDCIIPIAIVDSTAALSATRVVYLSRCGTPTLHIAAESDLKPLGEQT